MIQIETNEQVFNAVSVSLDQERTDLVVITRNTRYPGEVLRLKVEAIKRILIVGPLAASVGFEGTVVDVKAPGGLRSTCPTCGR